MSFFNWRYRNKSKSLLPVLQGNSEFTKQLYQNLAKTPGNLLFSPISLHAILSLAAQGSEGETREAFVKALRIPDLKTAAKGYHNVLTYLNSVKNVTLHIANKLFLHEDYKLLGPFKSVAVNEFLVKVKLLNFAESQEAAMSINSWVKRTTNGKIKDLISPGDLDITTSLVLVSAVYFRGKWKKPFKPPTRTGTFYINETDDIDVKIMRITEKFNFKYDDTLDAKVLELPYRNSAFSLVIILPDHRNGIEILEENLAQVDLSKILENMKYVEVSVALPKFKFEHTMDLRQPLTEIGLGDIFVPGLANFSGMIDCPSYVSKVVQKAFIEVKEEGTEAAAATCMPMMLCLAMLPPPPEEFIADHPFIIMLQAKQENFSNILFSGRVCKPDY